MSNPTTTPNPFSAATAPPTASAPLPTIETGLPRIAVSGNGVMGQLVRQALDRDSDLQYTELSGTVSGIIDFSHPDCLAGIIEYVMNQLASGQRIPVIIATTGHSEEQRDQIQQLAQAVPVVFASNFSPGVTILTKLLRDLSPLMADWDIEIVETHHNRKLDAPSGTALTLAAAISSTRPLLMGRHGPSVRSDEIGIHAVRGGDVRGVHEIFFFGAGETLTIKHEALDRGLFAAGAVRAMKFALEQKKPGLFSMEDVLFNA